MFNDGYGDITVGMPRAAAQATNESGRVQVFYGGKYGCGANNYFFDQTEIRNETAADPNDHFGSALASGDFNNDGFDDLVIGVPGEHIDVSGSDREDAGEVNILYGFREGLDYSSTVAGLKTISQQSPESIGGASEAYDRFGSTLAVGDFNNDTFTDLAIGVQNEDIGATEDAGAVNVIYGSANGLTETDNSIWYQDIAGGSSEEYDNFGNALASGDFNNDGYGDLAIGVLGQDVNTLVTHESAGAVQILYGSQDGITATDTQTFSQAHYGTPRAGNYFGFVLAAADFNKDQFDDLAVGIPYEEVEGHTGAGAVHIFWGSGYGVVVDDYQELSYSFIESSLLVNNDGFGYSIAAGDLTGDGYADLIVGLPFRDRCSLDSTGEILIFTGSSSGIGDLYWNRYQDGNGDAEALCENSDAYGIVVQYLPPSTIFPWCQMLPAILNNSSR